VLGEKRNHLGKGTIVFKVSVSKDNNSLTIGRI
jgi:hypothetical protein